MDCLLKENGKLKSQVATKEVQIKEVEALKVAAEAEPLSAWEERNKAIAISWRFHNFVEHPGNVVNKARLYDEGTIH